MTMRHGATARQAFENDVATRERADATGDRLKRDRLTAHDIEQTGASMHQTKLDDPRQVVYMNVIALFFAIAEEGDFSLRECGTNESVRTVTVVGVARPIYGTRAQDRERDFGGLTGLRQKFSPGRCALRNRDRRARNWSLR